MGCRIKQLVLPLTLDRQYSFDNFFSDQAPLILGNLKSLLLGNGEFQIGLWGVTSTGKTHLLNACARYAGEMKIALQFYDGRQLAEFQAGDFESIDNGTLLVIDNLDAIVGDAAWETFFYSILNRCHEGALRFIFSLSSNPLYLQTCLADFRSRLIWGLLLQLKRYEEADLRHIIYHRAHLLGMALSDEVISYLLTHHSRNLSVQMKNLRTLDNASLTGQRRVTIPLIKQTLTGFND